VVILLDLHLPMLLVPITINVISLNHTLEKLYSLQHFVLSLSATCGRSVLFCGYFRFPPPIKLTGAIKLKYYCVKHL